MDLSKLFVLVPSTSNSTVASIQAASLTTNKIYFMAKYNQIVAKGAVYGVDPTTGNELTTLTEVVGGVKGEDGTVTVDFSHLNYYTSEGTKTIIGAIEAIDAKVKAEMDKLGASKTLDANYEFTGEIKYVAAAEGVPAHIALVDEEGTELSTIPVSDIIGNGILKTSAYDPATGILTLTFAQADNTTKAIEVDLKAMLDINDISIAEGSKKYLEVALGTADAEGNTQAVFGAKIVNLAQATAENTGLVDAKDAKDYVDNAIKNLDKVSSTVDGANVHVTYKEEDGIVTIESVVEDYATITPTRTTSSADAPATDAAIAVAAGDEAKLVKASDLKAVADYAADKVTEEAHRIDKKLTETIDALDVPETPVSEAGEGAINFKYSETDGKVAINSLSVTYAEHSANAVTTGIVTGTVLNDVLADLWETYVDPQA